MFYAFDFCVLSFVSYYLHIKYFERNCDIGYVLQFCLIKLNLNSIVLYMNLFLIYLFIYL